jgi:hypothetical protein
VTIKQCIDPSSIEVTSDSKLEKPERPLGPYIRTVTLDRSGTSPFLVTTVIDVTSGKKVKKCGS